MPTVLLCHCDGTNGSTTLTDASASAHGFTSVSSAVLSTAQVKFGTAAVSCPTTAATFRTTAVTTDFDFQGSPFTIEGWVYATSAPATNAMVAQFSNASGGGWYFGVFLTHISFLYYNTSNTQVQFQSATVVPTGAWHFLTADRDAGGTLRLYLDGAVVATSSIPTFQTQASPQLNVGNSNVGTHGWNIGYIDEVRVTKGTALYAGAFTPPTAPFVNGGVAGGQSASAMVLA